MASPPQAQLVRILQKFSSRCGYNIKEELQHYVLCSRWSWRYSCF